MKQVLSVLTVLGMMLGMVGWPAPTGAAHLPTLLAEGGVTPVTDGEWVVWLSDQPGSIHELLVQRLATSEVAKIAEGLILRGGYDIDRGVVVWSEPVAGCQNQIGETCNQNVYARDLATGNVVDVAATGDVEEFPVISGSLVVWNAWDGESWHVRARDVATMSEPFTIFSENQTTAIEKYEFPVVSGHLVAWVTYWDDGNPETSPDWRLWVHDVHTYGPPLLVGEGLGMIDDFDLAGSTLVYVASGVGLVAIDVTTMATTPVAGYVTDVTTDGRYVTWRAGKGPDNDPSNGTDLWIHDLATGATFTVATGDRYVSSPHLGKPWLVWEQGGLPFPDDEYPHDIHAAPLADLLPSGRRPPADVPIPKIVYYPETGHYLGWQFRTYWEGNGGLSVFGYPLTEEYEERSADTGQFHTVQFLERQRFEWHPENAGTPYVVLLGRLGYEDALARGLLDSEPFQPILRDIVRGDCVWFGETRQMVCTDFIRYWRGHGLDFGDEGTTYRESLALFGFPISQPYIHPDTGLLTQYFERAVFELHPDNPDPYRVLLRRLGADALDARGW